MTSEMEYMHIMGIKGNIEDQIILKFNSNIASTKKGGSFL